MTCLATPPPSLHRENLPNVNPPVWHTPIGRRFHLCYDRVDVRIGGRLNLSVDAIVASGILVELKCHVSCDILKPSSKPR